MRFISLIVAAMLAGLGAFALWHQFDQPVPVEPSWDKPMSSVSFAPFRRGQSPLTKVYPSPAQVEEDMRSLVGLAQGIRTYTSREGMEVVPDLAAKYGLKVVFGAWLGSEVEQKGKVINEAEVTSLIKLANDHPDSINRVIVGNEVLLRGDLKPAELIAYIRRVKAAVKQPVSYADVWAFYLKYPEIANEVDYITIHILPFWEDEPASIDHVEEHVTKIVERIRQAFPGKPILIGEAGWPSIGRDRGPAVVSTVNEARFVRKMAQIADKYNFDYNIVEAFDQPWKSALENTVGAAWGIMDIDRKPKFQMAGPVLEVADWHKRAAIAIGAGALLTLLFGRAIPGLVERFLFAVLAQVLGWLAVTACFHAEAVAFRWWQDYWAILRGGVPVAFAVVALRRAADLLAGRAAADPADRWKGEAMTLYFGAYAFVWTALLFIDGRYRDIPVIDFGVPCVAIAALSLIRMLKGGGLAAWGLNGLFTPALDGTGRKGKLARFLSWGLPLAALLAVASEGLALAQGEDFTKDHPHFADQWPLVLNGMIDNREMVLWAVMLLVMSIPYLAWRKTTIKR